MMLFIHHAYGDGSSTLRSLFNLADEKETSASKHRKMSSSGTAVEQQQPQPQQQPQSQLVTSVLFLLVVMLLMSVIRTGSEQCSTLPTCL